MTRKSDILANGTIVHENLGPFNYFRVNSTTNPFQISFDGNTWQDATGTAVFGPLAKPQKTGGLAMPTGVYYRSVNNAAATVTAEYRQTPLESTLVGNQVTNVTATVTSVVLPTQQFLRPVPVPGVPVALNNGNFYTAKIIAVKTAAGDANTGNVKVGANAAVNNQPYILAPGDEITIEAPGNNQRRFDDWYVDADNANDGVMVIYS